MKINIINQATGVFWKNYGISIIAIIISGFSIYYAWEANTISKENREDYRAVEKLDLNPKILLQARFTSIGKSPPHITIKNIGPIEAKQIKARLIELRYLPNPKPRLAAITSSEDTFDIPDISHDRHYSFKISGKWNYAYFDRISKDTNIPIEHFIIEVFISYRKEPNLAPFNLRAFYFCRKDGDIIPERGINDNETYKDILDYLYKTEIDRNLIESDNDFFTDILHTVYEK